MLTVFASCVGAFVASCVPDDSVRPKFIPPQVQVEVAVPDGCARFQVAANPGQAAVVDTVYNTGACALDQLKIMQDSAATFDATTGTLRVAVVIKNIGTQTVRVPARLRFNADSTKMLDANNETVPGPSDILGYLADSVSGNGRIAWWRFDTLMAASGMPQVLAPNATSRRRWIEFRGTDWDKKVRLKLFTAGRYGDPVPALPPTSVPKYLNDSVSMDWNPAIGGFPFTRDHLLVQFHPSATLAQRQNAIDQVEGTVVGGFRMISLEGMYVIKLPPDPSGQTLLRAEQLLRTLAGVARVARNSLIPFQPTYLKPNDGPSWQSIDWKFTALASTDPKWALADVRMPMAWGCSVGDSTSRVGVIDYGFRLSGHSDLAQNVVQSSNADIPADTGRHGNWVASILAARGDNLIGMSGGGWRAALDLRDPVARDSLGNPILANGLHGSPYQVLIPTMDSVQGAGARVINISLGAGATRVLLLTDTARLNLALSYIGIFKDMVEHPLTGLPVQDPLFVISAGNVPNGDPRESVWPLLKDSLPTRTIVVAAMNKNGSIRTSMVGSSYIDVAAPGEDVGTMDDRGLLTASGASVATPIVSAIAHLIRSMAPTLTADSVRYFVIEGARKSGRTAGGYPVVDAYESLKLVAQRSGAPLCGNRLWASGTNIKVERGAITQSLPTGLFATDTIRNLQVQHGGRRIDVDAASGAGSVLTLANGTWTAAPWTTPNIPTSPTNPGGTWLSIKGISHNADTLFGALVYGGNTATEPLSVRVSRGPYPFGTVDSAVISLGVFPTTNIDGTDYYLEYPARIGAAFPVAGDSALLAVTIYHYQYTMGAVSLDVSLWPKEVRLYRVNLATVPLTLSSVATVPDSTVFWLGLSEDGREKVIATGRDSLWGPTLGSAKYSNCAIRWSRPRFSSVAGQVFDDSASARKSVAASPEGCPFPTNVNFFSGSPGSIAPRMAPGRRPFIAPAPPPTPTVKRSAAPRTPPH